MVISPINARAEQRLAPPFARRGSGIGSAPSSCGLPWGRVEGLRCGSRSFFDVDAQQHLLIVSPVRNEARHIERVVRSVACQTRAPDLWLVADDGSDDGTLALLRQLEHEVPFMKVVSLGGDDRSHPDRLGLALEAKAFNRAIDGIGLQRFSHIGKLDGDVELPEDYFEVVLGRFARDPELGITGGSLVEPRGAGHSWARVKAPSSHVHGALKLYSRECFEAVDGIHERLGWDSIDETYARMRGFAVERDLELVALHHRPMGTADGSLRGSARHGRCAYIAHSGVAWMLLRSVKIAFNWHPRGISGVAFAWGYARASLTGVPRVADADFEQFVKTERRRRIGRAVRFGMA
jgi:hypothetical protein